MTLEDRYYKLRDNKYHTFYRFQEGNSRYIFEQNKLIIANSPEIFDLVLECIESKVSVDKLLESTSKYSPQEVEDILYILEQYAEKDIFFTEESVQFKSPDNFNTIGFFSFAPVHKCNLNCTYCFAKAGDNYQEEEKIFTTSRLQEALDFIHNDYSCLKDCKEYRVDFVSGGEPLLNFEVIKGVRELGDQYFKETNKPLKVWMCTNGTLLSEEILQYLSDHSIGLGISIDGDQEAHDLMRKDQNGKGTYETVSNWIKKIINSPDYKRELKEIWALVVVTNQTKSLIDIVKHHKDLGLKSIQMKLVRADKESAYAINSKDVEHIKKIYSEFIEFLKAETDNNQLEYLKMILNGNDYLGKIIIRLILQRPVIFRCQAAKNKISISANGDIYPCDSFIGIEEFKMGNIKSGITNEDIQKRFLQATIYNRVKCQKCWARHVCGGDCYHNSYITNGAIEEPDEMICELNKFFIKKSISLIDYIDQTKPKLGAYLQKFLSVREELK